MIVLAPEPVIHYLQRQPAMYFGRKVPFFAEISRARGTINVWTDGPLLSTYDAVRDYTRTAEAVWLIQFKSWSPYHPFPIDEIWHGRLLGQSREFESRDGRLDVIRIELGGPN